MLKYLFPEYPHTFTSQLKGQSVVEHDRCEFEIDVEADDAEVSWYRDGKKINPEDGRVEIVVEGKKRKLIFKDTHLEDAGEITCKTNRDSSSCILKVARKKFFLNSKLRTLSVRNIWQLRDFCLLKSQIKFKLCFDGQICIMLNAVRWFHTSNELNFRNEHNSWHFQSELILYDSS